MEYGNAQNVTKNLQEILIVFNKIIKWQLTNVSNAEKKLLTKTLKKDFFALPVALRYFTNQENILLKLRLFNQMISDKKTNIDEETQNKIHQMQMIEQNFQAILMQKQAFQMELNETENALEEISKSKDDVFKLIGQIMIKADKKKTEQELKKKEELLSLRLSSLEKQESEFNKQLEEIRKEVMKKIK